jgi:hypothetical protein
LEVYLGASLTPYLFLKIKLDKLVCMDGIGEDELHGGLQSLGKPRYTIIT